MSGQLNAEIYATALSDVWVFEFKVIIQPPLLKASWDCRSMLSCLLQYACPWQVYTFGPTFRAENSNTTRHLAEFWVNKTNLVLLFCLRFPNAPMCQHCDLLNICGLHKVLVLLVVWKQLVTASCRWLNRSLLLQIWKMTWLVQLPIYSTLYVSTRISYLFGESNVWFWHGTSTEVHGHKIVSFMGSAHAKSTHQFAQKKAMQCL